MMDDVARDYLLLALSMGELEEGIVDSYYGPSDLRQQAAERGATPHQLAADAVSLRERVAAEVADEQRRRWLDRQLVALETLARRIGGEKIEYVDEVTRCFDAAPERKRPGAHADARRTLDELLPGEGTVQERLEARDARLTIAPERVGGILEWVVSQVRSLSTAAFPIPDGESVTISLVRDEPWSAYNWYDGDLRSRIEFNTDLPTRAQTLVRALAHETFPGHHLEHAWKEQRLVREQGRAECSVQLINTPEAYISEGLAEIGGKLTVDAQTWQSLLLEICKRADIPMTAADAEREWSIADALEVLGGSGGDAALMLHSEGRSRQEVLDFLVNEALSTPIKAEKSLEFISHPLWRTYVFCYAGGERLLTDWCAAAGDADAQRRRFFRLLTEQLTPSGIAEELPEA